MAFLRKVRKSPFWILRSRHPETGEWRDASTRLRHDSGPETREARRIAEKATRDEVKWSSSESRDTGNFGSWVGAYISAHYARPSSRKRYHQAWGQLTEFLNERRIRHPRQVRYELAAEYMDWRTKAGAKQNTARLEAKFLAFVMNEAIRRDLCDRNPIALAKIPRAAVQPKPDVGAVALQGARDEFSRRPQWMRNVFEIMLHLGCRFSEASMPMSQIDFESDVIHVADAKRPDTDPRKFYPVPLPPALRAYLLALRDSGAVRTAPALTREANRRFNMLLKVATGGATSHSLRVAFISRCHRAGLTELQTMRLVNHSSQLVHRIYSRLGVEDARAAMLRVPAVLPPPPPATKTPAPI